MALQSMESEMVKVWLISGEMRYFIPNSAHIRPYCGIYKLKQKKTNQNMVLHDRLSNFADMLSISNQ